MLSSEFNQQMGALLRSLETRVRNNPGLIHADEEDAKEKVRDAIVALVAVYLSM